MSFLPFHEEPEMQKAAFYYLEKKIISTFSKTKKEIYDNALEIYKKETGDDNFYITKEAHDIDGELTDHLYAVHYKEHRDASEFWNIYYTIEYKSAISQYAKDDEIEMYLKPTNGGILPQDHENIMGILVDNSEEYVTVKLKKNGELRTIKYIDIAIIID